MRDIGSAIENFDLYSLSLNTNGFLITRLGILKFTEHSKDEQSI